MHSLVVHGCSNEVRIFGSIEEDLLHKLDATAKQQNISRSEWLRHAIEAYLQNGDA
jgi:metal-responsive CopG/Arc/MetJ family transcriptional regulator